MKNAENTDMRHTDAVCVNEEQVKHPWWDNLKYLVVGIVFGITFVKAEIVSWFRIQEMFQLTSFHTTESLVRLWS